MLKHNALEFLQAHEWRNNTIRRRQLLRLRGVSRATVARLSLPPADRRSLDSSRTAF